MDHKAPIDFWDQVGQFLFKYGALLGYILLGLIGTFSFDLLRNRKMTIPYVLGCTGAAIFVGYVGGTWVLANYPEKAPILTPILTLLANNIISAVILNWKAIFMKDWKGVFEILTRKKD